MSQSSPESLIAQIAATQDDLAALQSMCIANAETRRDAVVAALEEICRSGKGNVAIRAAQLNFLVHHKEIYARQQANPSPYNAVSLDDWRFHAVQPEIAQWQGLTAQWLALKPDSYSGVYTRALSLIANQPAQSVEPLFAKLRAHMRADLPSITNFDARFHHGLEQAAEETRTAMPEFVAVRPRRGGERFVFSACDYTYFETYGLRMMASFRGQEANCGFHLHLFDTTDDEAQSVVARLIDMGLDNVSLSREWSGMRSNNTSPQPASEAARGYYHVARFFRFWQILRAEPETRAWLLDADSLFHGDLAVLFNRAHGQDISVWLVPGRVEPSNKIAAGLVGIAPTVRGRRFLQRVAGYAAACIKANVIPWGTDQTILYAVYVGMADDAPTIDPVNAAICDGHCTERAAIWPGKCDVKSPNYPNFAKFLQALKAA